MSPWPWHWTNEAEHKFSRQTGSTVLDQSKIKGLMSMEKYSRTGSHAGIDIFFSDLHTGNVHFCCQNSVVPKAFLTNSTKCFDSCSCGAKQKRIFGGGGYILMCDWSIAQGAELRRLECKGEIGFSSVKARAGSSSLISYKCMKNGKIVLQKKKCEPFISYILSIKTQAAVHITELLFIK